MAELFQGAHQRGSSAPPACGSWPGDPALSHSGPQHPASSSLHRSRTDSRSPRTASIQHRSGNLKQDNGTFITQPVTLARTSVKKGPGGLTDQELRWVWGSVRPSSHKCTRGSWSSWSSPTCRHNSLEDSGLCDASLKWKRATVSRLDRGSYLWRSARSPTGWQCFWASQDRS